MFLISEIFPYKICIEILNLVNTNNYFYIKFKIKFEKIIFTSNIYSFYLFLCGLWFNLIIPKKKKSQYLNFQIIFLTFSKIKSYASFLYIKEHKHF